MNSVVFQQILRPAVLLAFYGVVGTGIVAFVHHETQAQIAANEKAALLQRLHEIIPPEAYDNDLLADFAEVSNEALGTLQAQTVYLARKHGQPAGVVLSVVAPHGYNGPIKLLVGIREDGTLFGVRTVSHRETPGLGDKIELRHSNWITKFDGRSIGNPPDKGWAVKRDGGVFDQFTGATITPRAVVEAVRQALVYFSQHKKELFSQPPKQNSSLTEN